MFYRLHRSGSPEPASISVIQQGKQVGVNGHVLYDLQFKGPRLSSKGYVGRGNENNEHLSKEIIQLRTICSVSFSIMAAC